LPFKIGVAMTSWLTICPKCVWSTVIRELRGVDVILFQMAFDIFLEVGSGLPFLSFILGVIPILNSGKFNKVLYASLCINLGLPFILLIITSHDSTLLMLWVRIQLRRRVLDTTLCDKVCHWLASGRWFTPGTPVSSTNKTDRHDITEILLKVA